MKPVTEPVELLKLGKDPQTLLLTCAIIQGLLAHHGRQLPAQDLKRLVGQYLEGVTS